MSEVSSNFLSAFGDALSVDGDLHYFTFSGGASATLLCLWVKDLSSYIHTHTHNLNDVVFSNQKMCIIRECEVPSRAVLRANDYLTVDGTRYKIMNARLKDYLWTLQLMIMATT
jgi:hypothetical protein